MLGATLTRRGGRGSGGDVMTLLMRKDTLTDEETRFYIAQVSAPCAVHMFLKQQRAVVVLHHAARQQHTLHPAATFLCAVRACTRTHRVRLAKTLRPPGLAGGCRPQLPPLLLNDESTVMISNSDTKDTKHGHGPTSSCEMRL
jgi:hypothetical protein